MCMYRFFHFSFDIFHDSIAFGVYVYKYILHHVHIRTKYCPFSTHRPLSPTTDVLGINKNGLNCLLKMTENVTHIFFITTRILKKLSTKTKQTSI